MGRYREIFGSALKALDSPGPALEVQPFAPGTVTPAAGVLKAISTVIASRRALANWKAAEADKQASRYRESLAAKKLENDINGVMDPLQQAQIDNITADNERGATAEQRASDALEETRRHNRATEATQAQRAAEYARRASAREARAASAAGQIGRAKAGMAVLDAEKKRWVDDHINRGYQAAADKAGAAGLGATVEIDPATKKPVVKPADLKAARESWIARKRARLEALWEKKNAPRRKAFSDIIEQHGAILGAEQQGAQQDAQAFQLDMSGLAGYGQVPGVAP